MLRKFIGLIFILFGAFFVLWFFIAVAHLVIDPRKRGVVEICLTLMFLSLGLAMITFGHRRFYKR